MKVLMLTVTILIMSILSMGCSATPNPDAPYPASFMVEEENRFDYQPGLECAAFSSAYLLRHYGEEASGLELFKTIPNKLPGGEGVYPQGIITLFTEKGYKAEMVTEATVDDLKTQLAKGAPVIVYIHVEEPYTNPHYTHYVPLVGYDETYFYFAESLDYMSNCKEETGLKYNRKTEISKFEKLWTNVEGMYMHPYFKITKQE